MTSTHSTLNGLLLLSRHWVCVYVCVALETPPPNLYNMKVLLVCSSKSKRNNSSVQIPEKWYCAHHVQQSFIISIVHIANQIYTVLDREVILFHLYQFYLFTLINELKKKKQFSNALETPPKKNRMKSIVWMKIGWITRKVLGFGRFYLSTLVAFYCLIYLINATVHTH